MLGREVALQIAIPFHPSSEMACLNPELGNLHEDEDEDVRSKIREH
jgi:hypothetical protein